MPLFTQGFSLRFYPCSRKSEENSLQELWELLKKLDPDCWEVIDRDNPRRVIRAIEFCMKTGQKFSGAQKQGHKLFDELIIGISLSSEQLDDRIEKRVEQQVKEGLLDETVSLAKRYPWKLPSMSGIGYRQMGMYLRGELSWDEAVRKLKVDTHRYAKRQMTWWKKDKRIHWVKVPFLS